MDDMDAPDILLTNAHALTLDRARPRADTIAVRGGRIAWVGACGGSLPILPPHTQVIDCGGQTIVPGFIDAHCHILAYASALTAVDCSATAVSSISDIVNAIRQRAQSIPRGAWIRAAGYREFDLQEKRHPTRRDLDAAAPHHPVRLNHRSGHACVLNSLALQRIGVHAATEEPPGGTIARDLDTAEPNGLLLEMSDFLDARIPRLSAAELDKGVALANRRLLAAGVVSVHDATPANSVERWDAMRRLRESGIFTPSVVMMAGADRIDGFADRGLSYGSGDAGALALGHAKIMLTQSGGRLFPSPAELSDIVAAAHARGFPVAIHAVESDAVDAAAHALAANRAHGRRDRIEHASECPPHTLEALRKARAVVVTQPGFIDESASRYLAELGVASKWLYRIGALAKSGLIVAASSDAPASRPDPLAAMRAAVTLRDQVGTTLNAGEGVSAMQALRMYTTVAAYAACQESDRGSIAPGKRADLAVLSANPIAVPPEVLGEIKVTMTIVGGRIAWRM